MSDQITLAITNCRRSRKSQDWTLPGKLRVTIVYRGEDTFTLRLARQGSLPSVTDTEVVRAALPQIATAVRIPEVGYNRTVEEDGKVWRWVSFTFDVKEQPKEE
jgi:hypothetical protein